MTARTPDEFEARLRDYLFERAEETRAVRSGLKASSEQAAIVARYADLFSREQLAALRDAWEHESDSDERERLHRLRHTCESGLIVAQIAPELDALQNAELRAEVEFDGQTLPLRTATARLGTLSGYEEREELGRLVMDAASELNEQRLGLTTAREALRVELSGEPDPLRRSDHEKGISLEELAGVLAGASELLTETYAGLRERWLDRLLGSGRAAVPASYHAPFVYRLSALAGVYSKERATDVCLTTLRELGLDLEAEANIQVDLDDRPQKAPRPAVIPSDPPTVVHLVTRAQGGLQDYQALLHEAGHAFHFAGCDPELPYAFRKLSRDNALTEVYSYTTQSVIREPAWHARHFDLSDEDASENAEAARYLDAFVFRRNVAKLHFELEFWGRFHREGASADGYAERLTEATGFAYRPDRYLADMDADFYSADYLRAAIRSAQLRARLRADLGDDWWRSGDTGGYLRELFRQGTKPSNEGLADRLGFDALDTAPLVEDLARVETARSG